ncbi:hypothetical protein [Novosphingobium sp. M1R2S20]|uniref:HTTM domain-containing protein n=1 Tax=Novosphingobium rhizovicinum TaxID=3228928 RepID=A0ABV3R7K0_9SPHN
MRLVIAFSAIASIVGSLEWVRLRRHLQDEQLFSWRIQSVVGTPSFALNYVFAYPRCLMLPILQILFSLPLLVPAMPATAAGVSAICAALCAFLLSIRGVDGFNGGDAMAKLVLLSGGVCLLTGSAALMNAGLVFLAGQLVIAYSTPGFCRILDRDWHTGKRIMGVLRTETFGRPWAWQLLRSHPWLAHAVGSGIAIWETFFAVYLFLPLELLLPLLLIGVAFHTSNAVVMGLNIFPWSFIGTYPAVVWTALFIRGAIW